MVEVGVIQYLLGLANLAFLLGIAPLLDGIQRKLAARMHSRIGPPITQGYRDLVKLIKRSMELIPRGSKGLYSITPAALLAITSVTALITPVIFVETLPISDIILIAYLLALGEALLIMTSFDTSNPFAVIGCGRKAVLTLIAEVSLMAAVFSMVIKPSIATTALYGIAAQVSSSLSVLHTPSYYLAFIAAMLAVISELELTPYDIGVAEQEILGGVEVEYGGRGLGFLKYAQLIKRLVLITIFIDVFIPWGIAGDVSPASVGVSIGSYLLKSLAMFAAASIALQPMARFRVRGATKSLLASLVFAFLSIILSSMGV